jgi:hypothetical protein
MYRNFQFHDGCQAGVRNRGKHREIGRDPNFENVHEYISILHLYADLIEMSQSNISVIRLIWGRNPSPQATVLLSIAGVSLKKLRTKTRDRDRGRTWETHDN